MGQKIYRVRKFLDYKFFRSLILLGFTYLYLFMRFYNKHFLFPYEKPKVDSKNNILKHRMGKIASTILKSCKQLRIECGEFEPFKAKIDLPG